MTFKGAIDELIMLATHPHMPFLFKPSLNKVVKTLTMSKFIEISPNATNGDVIMAMFPGVESEIDEKTGIVFCKWTDGNTKLFALDWWNAPYKTESEDKK